MRVGAGIRILFSAALLAVLGAIPAPLYAQFNSDPAVQFDTPGFAPGRADFTSHEEMVEYVYALQRAADNLQVRIAGSSQEGRAIPFLVLSNSGLFASADLPLDHAGGVRHAVGGAKVGAAITWRVLSRMALAAACVSRSISPRLRRRAA